MTQAEAFHAALCFYKEWGVRSVVYGYKRSNKWRYQHHPTFALSRHPMQHTEAPEPTVPAQALPDSRE